MPFTSPSCRCLSSSSLVLSSIARMSSIVRPYQLSIQQNTCLLNDNIKPTFFLTNIYLTCGTWWRDVARTVEWTVLSASAGRTTWTRTWPTCSKSSPGPPSSSNQLLPADRGLSSAIWTFSDPQAPCSPPEARDRWQCQYVQPRGLSAYPPATRAPAEDHWREKIELF